MSCDDLTNNVSITIGLSGRDTYMGLGCPPCWDDRGIDMCVSRYLAYINGQLM